VHDENGDLIARYFYGVGQLERLLDPSNGLQYYHNDALGSPIAITDQDGIAEARYAYDAFGQYRRNEESDTENIFGFIGHEWDEDTELLYAKARYYDRETARFLAQDPFEGNLNTPPSLHKYLYAYQNPTVYVDPDGREPARLLSPSGIVDLSRPAANDAWGQVIKGGGKRVASRAGAGRGNFALTVIRLGSGVAYDAVSFNQSYQDYRQRVEDHKAAEEFSIRFAGQASVVNEANRTGIETPESTQARQYIEDVTTLNNIMSGRKFTHANQPGRLLT
jgi:RHS repeat-associated protein